MDRRQSITQFWR